MWYVVFGAAQVHAAESAILRAGLAKPGPVLVGEHVAIRVDLLTTTTFASAPIFELPTIPGALLMKIADHPILGTEEIDGGIYTVQHHELALFSMRPGVAQVPPFTVRFESPLKFGEQPVEYQLTTPALQVEVRMPPGAESLAGLIVARELQVNQTWQPQPQKTHVGDSFTRTVTLTAPNVPAMVFPPLPLGKVDGLAVYPKAPVVHDQVERGEFTGKRIETVIYICERSGQVTVPALVIPWWDLQKQRLMQVTLPAVTLEVEPGPASNADAAAPEAEAPGRQWLWWIVGAILLLAAALALVWSQRETLLTIGKRRQAQRKASEAGCFARLRDACRASNGIEAYNALLRWLDSTHRGPDSATIEAFLARYPDVELRRQVEALQESILRGAMNWDGAALVNALGRVRRQYLHRAATTEEARLPTLNPPWVGALLIAALFSGYDGRGADAAMAMAPQTYGGAQACVACHPRQAELKSWRLDCRLPYPLMAAQASFKLPCHLSL